MAEPAAAAAAAATAVADVPSGEAPPTLVWSLDQTKTMFKTDRLWPSFVGAKRDVPYYANAKQQQKANAGLLPVLLWREQEQYLAQKNAAPKRKRKHSDVGEAEGEDQGEAAQEPNTDADAAVNDEVGGKGKPEAKDDEAPAAKRSRPQSYSPFRLGLNRLGSFFASLASSAAAAFTSLTRGEPLPTHTPDWAPERFTRQSTLPKEAVQLKVFSACQARGYFIGPGDVYGGDYNIYRGGDPSNSHSTATVRVVRKRAITGRDLLSYSRVQNQVAKSAVLAFVDPDNEGGEPGFLVVNFRNVSERL